MFPWLMTKQVQKPLSLKKALRQLLATNPADNDDAELYLQRIEEATGHPDIAEMVERARQEGLSAQQLLRQIRSDVLLMETLLYPQRAERH